VLLVRDKCQIVNRVHKIVNRVVNQTALHPHFALEKDCMMVNVQGKMLASRKYFLFLLSLHFLESVDNLAVCKSSLLQSLKSIITF
jgi:hypothetical protein